jgi:hypothetical protein
MVHPVDDHALVCDALNTSVTSAYANLFEPILIG